MEMRRLTRDGTVELVSRDQILRRGRGQGNFFFPVLNSADHVLQDWQRYPVDPSSCYILCVTIYTYHNQKQCNSITGGYRTIQQSIGANCLEHKERYDILTDEEYNSTYL